MRGESGKRGILESTRAAMAMQCHGYYSDPHVSNIAVCSVRCGLRIEHWICQCDCNQGPLQEQFQSTGERDPAHVNLEGIRRRIVGKECKEFCG